MDARFLKVGGFCRSDRMSKLNRLVEIEAELMSLPGPVLAPVITTTTQDEEDDDEVDKTQQQQQDVCQLPTTDKQDSTNQKDVPKKDVSEPGTATATNKSPLDVNKTEVDHAAEPSEVVIGRLARWTRHQFVEIRPPSPLVGTDSVQSSVKSIASPAPTAAEKKTASKKAK